MHDPSEYVREKQLYLSRLDAMATALHELGDSWSLNFVGSLRRQIARQSINGWGPTPRQRETLRGIEAKHGELLTNPAKRQELLRRRAVFLERFEKLKHAANDAQDVTLQRFIKIVEQQMREAKPLTDGQKETLQRALHQYRIAAYEYDRRV